MTHIKTVIEELRIAQIPMSDALGAALDGLLAQSERLRAENVDSTLDKNAHEMTLDELRDAVGALRCEIVRRGFGEKELRAENERLRQALRFYAHRCHLTLGDPHAWDIVSGEPPNYLCDEAGTATIEDGTIACMALRGVYLGDEIEEFRMPIEGEPNALPVSGEHDD